MKLLPSILFIATLSLIVSASRKQRNVRDTAKYQEANGIDLNTVLHNKKDAIESHNPNQLKSHSTKHQAGSGSRGLRQSDVEVKTAIHRIERTLNRVESQKSDVVQLEDAEELLSAVNQGVSAGKVDVEVKKRFVKLLPKSIQTVKRCFSTPFTVLPKYGIFGNKLSVAETIFGKRNSMLSSNKKTTTSKLLPKSIQTVKRLSMVGMLPTPSDDFRKSLAMMISQQQALSNKRRKLTPFMSSNVVSQYKTKGVDRASIKIEDSLKHIQSQDPKHVNGNDLNKMLDAIEEGAMADENDSVATQKFAKLADAATHAIKRCFGYMGLNKPPGLGWLYYG